MTWRIAKSLEKLRHQIDAKFPGRSKASDGGIGDAAHATRDSDHNPWVVDGNVGVVTARDFTCDPNDGADTEALAEKLRLGRDMRIKYVIYKGRMFSSYKAGSVAPWAWRPYTGKNPHNHHFHISVQPEKARYDSEAEWAI
jgi:hypothetical protein